MVEKDNSLSYDRKLWFLTLTIELRTDMIKMNHRAKYPGEMSFLSIFCLFILLFFYHYRWIKMDIKVIG